MSNATSKAFGRISEQYGQQGQPAGGTWAPPGEGQPPPGYGHYGQPGQGQNPWGQGNAAGGYGTVPRWDVGKRFKASRAYDKLLTLVTITVVCGVAGYFSKVPSGVAFGCVVVAFFLALSSWFKPQWARFTGPAYSVVEGVALGVISSAYSHIGHGIIPTAIVFTGGVFLAALGLYRTGLVKVTPRMAAMAFMGAVGLALVAGLSMLGLPIPGLNSFGPVGIIIGVVMLAIAVLNLFVDFDFVQRAEHLQLPADAEWSAAFAMMTALVLVYLSILRIIASMYGGGGRR